MIEGIIVCVVLVLALIGLHKWNKPKKESAPVPEVKPEVQPERKPAANPLFEAQYGQPTDWGKAAREEREAQERRAIRRDAEEREARLRRQRIREEEEERQRIDAYNVDSSADLLTTVVVTAAAVVVAETLYDSFSSSTVDTAPVQEYSSPTPSYSEPTSTYSSPDTSTYDSTSSWD